MSIQFAPVWNNSSVVQTCIRANATDTASAASSTLIELSVNGIIQFSVDKTGDIIMRESISPQVPSAGYISVYAGSGRLNIMNSSGMVSTLPRITSGVSEPSGGSSGDIYLQYNL